jgi:hypothetical protein
VVAHLGQSIDVQQGKADYKSAAIGYMRRIFTGIANNQNVSKSNPHVECIDLTPNDLVGNVTSGLMAKSGENALA